MTKVCLINCAATKKNYPCPAKEMWADGRLFRKCLAYARTVTTDEHIYVVTFAHGLFTLDAVIEPYDIPLASVPKDTRMIRMYEVSLALAEKYDFDNTHFTLLTTAPYNKYLVPRLRHYEMPLETLRMGDQLRFLSGNTEKRASLQDMLNQIIIRLDRIERIIGEQNG